jgi:histidinol-phosphatase (PHP family)
VIEQDGRARDLPLDSHLHTDLSPDSDVPIDSYARQAVELGIAEIAITDHVDFQPGAPAYDHTTFAERERVVRDAAERWADRGVAIRFGVELTYDRTWESDIRDHLARHAYDFTIGSWHEPVGSVYAPGRVAGWVAGRTLGEIVRPSFDEVIAAARSGLFDTIGHIDVVKRYLHPHVDPDRFASAPELYEPILRAIIDGGSALEINTSGLRHAIGQAYPPPPIVAMFWSMGGRAITIGSDAHRERHFAWGLNDGYDAASESGFESLAFRRGEARVAVPIVAPGSSQADTRPNVTVGRSL